MNFLRMAIVSRMAREETKEIDWPLPTALLLVQ